MDGNDKARPDDSGQSNAGIDRAADSERQTKPVSWYQRKRIMIPLVLFIIAAAGIYLYWDVYLRGYVSTDDAYIDGNRMIISSKILGRIVKLEVDEGDTVQKGQLLVGIDDSDLQADKAEAEANIAYAEQNVELAGVSLELARDDFNRADAQYKDNIITVQEHDHAKRALELAKVKYNMAQAAIKTDNAALAVINTKLANTQLYAPYDGVVAKRWVIDGDVVSPGQPIFTVFDLQDIWVTANFEETKIASFQVGDSVRISVDAFPDNSYSGVVMFVGAATASQFSLIPPNNASGNFTKVTQRVPVKISIRSDKSDPKDGPAKLIPGMSVVVDIDTRNKAK
jgi:membrane fusion protein (multidrug efflux system)